tara:strand:+ start:533 stop:934 length:402 start_codon:yes stop_codon:yes gene_type:complete
MELPKVNIAVAASAVVAICSTLGGGVWYMSQQASVIEALQSDLEKLTVANSAVDRTNLIRDVEENKERIEELIDYLIDLEDEGESTATEVYEEIDSIYDDLNGLSSSLMDIIKLSARVSILEKTLQYTKQDGM